MKGYKHPSPTHKCNLNYITIHRIQHNRSEDWKLNHNFCVTFLYDNSLFSFFNLCYAYIINYFIIKQLNLDASYLIEHNFFYLYYFFDFSHLSWCKLTLFFILFFYKPSCNGVKLLSQYNTILFLVSIYT